MTVLPVIARELRASARQPFTYTLRLAGAAALLLASVLFGLHFGFEAGVGRQLFAALHATLFGAIWVLVPMLTADCLSRERREGTLGLLFLTPLKGTDIVVAKALAHGLRAITLWLAVLPVLTIPFLIGGVSWAEAALSVLVNANAMCWALTAGLLASAWNKAWLRALLLAALFASICLFIFEAGVGWLMLQALDARQPGRIDLDWDHALAVGFGVISNGAGRFYLGLWGWSWVSMVAGVLAKASVLSLLAMAAAVLVAGAKTRRSWREEPPSRWRVWLERTFCTPVLWRSFLQQWMRRKLERNPIGWLEQRTWSGRLVTWGWFAVLISVYSTVLADRNSFHEANPMQMLIASALAVSIAASAAGSFRRERETGVLELLLVSPLGESRIIAGRLGGLWSQFLPAAGLVLAVWVFFSTFLPHETDGGMVLFFIAAFLALPVFGLYFSLQSRNFLMAFLATVLVGMLVPLALAEGLRWVFWGLGRSTADFSWHMRPCGRAAVCQAVLAIICWDRLFWRLKRRAFPLERSPLN